MKTAQWKGGRRGGEGPRDGCTLVRKATGERVSVCGHEEVCRCPKEKPKRLPGDNFRGSRADRDLGYWDSKPIFLT